MKKEAVNQEIPSDNEGSQKEEKQESSYRKFTEKDLEYVQIARKGFKEKQGEERNKELVDKVISDIMERDTSAAVDIIVCTALLLNGRELGVILEHLAPVASFKLRQEILEA